MRRGPAMSMQRVRYTSALIALASMVVCMCIHQVIAIPSVPVESFSLSDLENKKGDSVMELLAALEAKGIVAIRGIPNYVNLRQQYLDIASECVAQHASSSSSRGIQSKTLRDGTQRVTISTKSQLNNPALAQSGAIDQSCPQYLPELRAFSELVNLVALTLAKTIDTALVDSPSHLKTSSSLEEIVSEAHHLDHFHSYSSPSSSSSAVPSGDANKDDAVLSLDLHTDNGVMIFMAKPAFYAHASSSDKSVRRISPDAMESGPMSSAGLVIKQPRQSHVVQPVLKDDELIVMIGDGYRSWMYSDLDFKPVLHGMQMPTFSPTLGQVSRAWFGKMILLPKHHQIKNTKMTFGEYTDRATQYVLSGGGGKQGMEPFSTVACPPYSQLIASDKACALQLYEPSEDSRASREECMTMCNTHADEECLALCQYVATIPRGGVDCWMLCLASDVCASNQVARCDPSGAQQTVCVPDKTL